DVVAVGPGLGRGDGVSKAVAELLSRFDGPAVIDADAINALAAIGEGAASALCGGRARGLTPHPGEAARLLGRDASRVAADPLGAAHEIMEKWQAVVLVKGNPT